MEGILGNKGTESVEGENKRREQKKLKGPRIQNSFSVIEQMFERRTSGTRESVVGRSSFVLLLIFLCIWFLKSIVQFQGAHLSLADAGGL